MPRILSNRGRPTSYGLACGYVDVRIRTDTLSVELWTEHGTIHVRRCDRTLADSDRARIGPDGSRIWRQWDSFPSYHRTQAYQRLAELTRLPEGYVLPIH